MGVERDDFMRALAAVLTASEGKFVSVDDASEYTVHDLIDQIEHTEVNLRLEGNIEVDASV